MTALTVAFEGLPGSGKTTALEGIKEDLSSEGLRVQTFDIDSVKTAPELTALAKELPIGHRARVMVYWILRIQQHEQMRSLPNTDVILADRAWASNIAYDHYGNGVPREVLDWVGDGVEPSTDLTLFFDATLDTVIARKKAVSLQDPTFAERVALGYRELAEANEWTRIDAEQDPASVRKEAFSHVAGRLGIYGSSI